MLGKYKILIVEDEVTILELIKLYLENRNFIVFTAVNGEEALHIVNEQSPDLILLDIEMPEMDGFEVCKQIREKLNVPIIFISSRRDVSDKVRSFELGGDDYLTKPFDFVELEARIHANLRRYKSTKMNEIMNENILRFEGVEINLDSMMCHVNGKPISLSMRELEILITLAKRPTQVWSAENLYDHIWGYDSIGDIQTIKVHISNLRKKINVHLQEKQYIETVRGFGYRFTS